MKLLPPAAVLATTLLAACGGGGSASSPTTAATPAVAAPRATALADNAAPAGFDFAMARSVAGLRSSELVPDASRYADPARTYVSLWVTGPAQERLQLGLLSLQVLQALDARGGLVLQLPTPVTRVSFEVYDARGAASAQSGEITR